jgi:uncharacterized protein (TIGR00255 family)
VHGGEDVSVELKSVNHKFCEVKARLPRELLALEAQLVKQVKARLNRGAVDLTVKRASRSATGTVPVVDAALAKEYRRAFAEIAAAAGIEDGTTVAQLASQSGVLRLEEPAVDVEAASVAVHEALSAALDSLMQMRSVEGVAVAADMTSRLDDIEKRVQRLSVLAPQSVTQWQAQLTERVAELGRGISVDPQRLAQEVVMFAERTDVAEELTRLKSHIQQFKTLLAGAEPAGRKLDFLVQEMHREVNTTGSKSQHADISTEIVAMKAELERIREQVQNVE